MANAETHCGVLMHVGTGSQIKPSMGSKIQTLSWEVVMPNVG